MIFLCFLGGNILYNIYEKLKKNRLKSILLFFLLILGLWVIAVFNLNMGAMKVSANEILKIIIGKTFSNAEILKDIKPNIIAVVWEIRLPRILCGILVGAGLSIGGVIFQSILQNPLADPYTLGVSTGASFGASLMIFINIMYGIYIPISFGALSFALLTLVLVVIIAKHGNSLESSELIIAGIIVSSFFSAGISLLKMLSGENVGAIVFWLMGSLSSKNWKDVYLISPVIILGFILTLSQAQNLNIMAMGDNNAKALGVNPTLTRFLCLIIGAFLTAFCVCVCGIIGFIGLVIPHLLRFWISSDNKLLIPFSALAGGILLCVADNITRVLTSGEIPVGILTTLIGGPFFIYIFVNRRKRGRNYE